MAGQASGGFVVLRGVVYVGSVSEPLVWFVVLVCKLAVDADLRIVELQQLQIALEPALE